jgi:tetratricopeptide (TPR) repeat protein
MRDPISIILPIIFYRFALPADQIAYNTFTRQAGNFLAKMKSRILILTSAILLSFFSSCEKKKEVDNQTYWDIITHRTLGLAYLEENKLDEAESEFLTLIELAPDEALGHANLGLVYLRKGQLEEAEKRLNTAIQLEPEDPEIRLMRSRAFELNSKPEEAIRDLEEAIDIDPNHVKSLYRLGDIYSSSSQEDAPELRKKYLLQIVELEPANIAPRMNLIEVLIASKEYDTALENLEEIKKLYPELPKESLEYYNNAVSGLQQGQFEGAQTATQILHNYLKVTANYQAGLQNLKGPGGMLIGVPIITFSQQETAGLEEGVSILDAIRFTDVTKEVGLNAFNTSGMNSHLAICDYDGDGDQDLYYGVGKSHFLLRNDIGRFTDVAPEVGINHSGSDFDASFIDFDNDGFLDLYIASEGQDHLYHNRALGEFVDISVEGGITSSDASNSALFFDFDHDGDLDLFVAKTGRNSAYQNNSDGTFRDIGDKMAFSLPESNSKDAVFGDFDEDGDIDLFVINEDAANSLYSNLRGGIFEDITTKAGIEDSEDSQAVTQGDYNNDGFIDLFIAGNSPGSFILYKNNRDGTFEKDSEYLPAGLLNNIIGKDIDFFDFDNDGFLDILIVGDAPNSSGRGVVLLHNHSGTGYKDVSNLLPDDLRSGNSLKVSDYNGDGDMDLFIADQNGVKLIRNDGGNTNHHLKVQLVGLRAGSGKNNHFGIGAKIEMRSGDLYQMKVVNEPVVHFGLGHRTSADVVRILWTNGVPQNIFTPEGDQELVEQQILKGSCPFLYTWNGAEYVFVKDIMWRSALGMPMGIMAGERAHAFPNASKEYIKIPGELLKPKDGRYTIQVTEELWETVYFDEAKMVAVDHPNTVDIFVDERFTPPPFSGMEIYQVNEMKLPVSAEDERGNDLLPLISKRDNKYISNLDLEKFQGVTKNHDLILDLGDLSKSQKVRLYLNGWIFPSDASINVNISQSESINTSAPNLQVINKKGEWETVIEYLGFPMGKDKTIIADLSNKFKTEDYRVRIQTNMQIYWDYIFYSDTDLELQINTTQMIPESADIHYRGYSKMYRKGGRYGPHWFDYNNTESGQKWRDLTGTYTRYGDVTDLLQESDSKYIIANAGDEVTIHFDASQLPELPENWKRDFLIYTVGWVKDGDLNTAFGQTVKPLPFHEMSSYPYGLLETYPIDKEYEDYMNKYNTRRVDTKEFKRAVLDSE